MPTGRIITHGRGELWLEPAARGHGEGRVCSDPTLCSNAPTTGAKKRKRKKKKKHEKNCGTRETWTLWRSEEKRIEAFEMWIWRRMECVKWTDRVRKEAVLQKVGEERMMLKLIRKRKRSWLSHWLRRKCLLEDALEEMVNGRKVRDRRYQMIDDIKIAYMDHMRRQRGRQKIGKTGECWAGGKRPLERPRRRWEDNIKMDLKEVGCDDRDWINLAQDRDRWRPYVRVVMNLRIP
ncbi:hypothetical protein ANN_15412 [Periplaneta americana]|uniref:Uncharacterized protein n=1 Tax=Periplaneta americana TaxID=6978 RepID=A0ABQ8SI75_PERAM|nr:hypothetical protein ANN_15412 [Periplaneta americana]